MITDSKHNEFEFEQQKTFSCVFVCVKAVKRKYRCGHKVHMHQICFRRRATVGDTAPDSISLQTSGLSHSPEHLFICFLFSFNWLYPFNPLTSSSSVWGLAFKFHSCFFHDCFPDLLLALHCKNSIFFYWQII